MNSPYCSPFHPGTVKLVDRVKSGEQLDVILACWAWSEYVNQDPRGGWGAGVIIAPRYGLCRGYHCDWWEIICHSKFKMWEYWSTVSTLQCWPGFHPFSLWHRPVEFTWTITRNYRAFGCPIICRDTYSQCYLSILFIISPIGQPYLSIIAGNEPCISALSDTKNT